MRREGYELQIGQPQVIIKEIDGVKCEPVEELTIDLPENVSGKAVDFVTLRKGEMLSMEPKGERMVIKFPNPFSWHYRVEKPITYCYRRRGYHTPPFLGVSAFQGGNSRSYQWITYLYGTGYRYSLLFGQASGQRSFLHLPWRRYLYRTGDWRKFSPVVIS